MMLQDFLTSNREELLNRCNAKVDLRGFAVPASLEPRRGVPLFLNQLGEALRRRQTSPAPFHEREGNRTASVHGGQMQEEGYPVDQVVHDYGDVCQAITELAREKGVPITVEEFQILNRLLDNAIADAVSSYETHRDFQGDLDLHQRLGTLAEEQRRHLDKALKAFEALKAGHIGLRGATGSVLEDSLMKLRDLIDKSHPELRLSAGMAKPPPA
jgi:hypothetical protein